MASCGGRGGGGCKSNNCSNLNETIIDSQTLENNTSALNGDAKLCIKCGESDQSYNSMCLSCFRLFLYGKFKFAVTTNAMISPTDRILVAFSGGICSRVALQFIHEMQQKALESWNASKSQALPVFEVGVAVIDEGILSPNPAHEIEQALENIRLIVSELNNPCKQLHVTPIENIYGLEYKEARNKLKELLLTISDATGQEDFLQHLRMRSLQKIALDNKYTKLMLGSCMSTIARHILSSTVKGRGYSLPADLQYVDSRWEVPVVLPLRDCVAAELEMLCHIDSLKAQQVLGKQYSGINGLVSSFVARLQEDNPSREHTIVRTAGKLKPFSFNKFTENGYHDFLPSRLRYRFQNVQNGESDSSEDLCEICRSPMTESDAQRLKVNCETPLTGIEKFVANCCQSCCFQILPNENTSVEHFYSLLPESFTYKVKERVPIDHDCLRFPDTNDQRIKSIIQEAVKITKSKDKYSDLVSIVISTAVWSIWNHRNYRVFGGKILNTTQICKEIHNLTKILLANSRKKDRKGEDYQLALIQWDLTFEELVGISLDDNLNGSLTRGFGMLVGDEEERGRSSASWIYEPP